MSHVINHHRPLGAVRTSAPASAFGRIAAAFAVWRQRRALAELPEHLRRDVGLSTDDVHREAARPLWDIPGHWRL